MLTLFSCQNIFLFLQFRTALPDCASCALLGREKLALEEKNKLLLEEKRLAQEEASKAKAELASLRMQLHDASLVEEALFNTKNVSLARPLTIQSLLIPTCKTINASIALTG